jgi:hypothetical protein
MSDSRQLSHTLVVALLELSPQECQAKWLKVQKGIWEMVEMKNFCVTDEQAALLCRQAADFFHSNVRIRQFRHFKERSARVKPHYIHRMSWPSLLLLII